MMPKNLLTAFFMVCLILTAVPLQAQVDPMDAAARAVAEDAANDQAAESVDAELGYDDYTVKTYALTLFSGQFSGATYLDLKALGDRTIIAVPGADVLAYDGTVLIESRNPNYTAPNKKIKESTAFGGRIGIYISDDFHLDLVGTYAAGEAVTTMLFSEDSDDLETNPWERVTVDTDDGFKFYKGGLSLMYDATPAKKFGFTPQLGFGLGGVINRFTVLEDKTSLYLEGSFGLNYDLFDDFRLGTRVDLSIFSMQVDELGYSAMVSYTTLTVGATWDIGVLPDEVAAAHKADRRRR